MVADFGDHNCQCGRRFSWAEQHLASKNPSAAANFLRDVVERGSTQQWSTTWSCACIFHLQHKILFDLLFYALSLTVECRLQTTFVQPSLYGTVASIFHVVHVTFSKSLFQVYLFPLWPCFLDWIEQSLTPRTTQYRSFRRRSSQPIT